MIVNTLYTTKNRNTKSSGTIAVLDPLTNCFTRLFLRASVLRTSLIAKNIIKAITAIILQVVICSISDAFVIVVTVDII